MAPLLAMGVHSWLSLEDLYTTAVSILRNKSGERRSFSSSSDEVEKVEIAYGCYLQPYHVAREYILYVCDRSCSVTTQWSCLPGDICGAVVTVFPDSDNLIWSGSNVYTWNSSFHKHSTGCKAMWTDLNDCVCRPLDG